MKGTPHMTEQERLSRLEGLRREKLTLETQKARAVEKLRDLVDHPREEERLKALIGTFPERLRKVDEQLVIYGGKKAKRR